MRNESIQPEILNRQIMEEVYPRNLVINDILKFVVMEQEVQSSRGKMIEVQ